jgi:protein-S-isoprenylcysteine O-methyltransferase Ste14
MSISPSDRLRDNASALLRSRAANLATALLLAWLWGMFCYAHLQAWQHTGVLSHLLFAASESLVALLFLLRHEAAAVSAAPGDWLLAVAGTAAPMLFDPSGGGHAAGSGLVLAGVLLQIGGLLSLNRSFGLVAARRQVKTGGLYRVVRHPLYVSYLLMYSGYVVVNPSLANLLLAVLAAALLVGRIGREERFLARDLAYQAYMDQVRYRLIPQLY